MIELKYYLEQKLNEGLIPEEEQLVKYYYKWLSKLDFCHPLRILEVSTGLYDGQHSLADFLAREVVLRAKPKTNMSNPIKFTKDELRTHRYTKNIFFDEIIIKYQKFGHIGACTFKNGILTILLNSNELTKYQTICSTISHELKHAWQDYKTDFSDNAPSKIAKTKQYKDIINKLNDSDINSSTAAMYAYTIINVERDAFTSEFSSELKILIKKRKPKSINECIDLAKEINVFNDVCTFKYLYEFLDKNDQTGQITKEGILNKLSELKNKKYTWEGFYYNFIRKLEKFHDKMCNIIALLYFEYAGPEKKEKIIDETEDWIH